MTLKTKPSLRLLAHLLYSDNPHFQAQPKPNWLSKFAGATRLTSGFFWFELSTIDLSLSIFVYFSFCFLPSFTLYPQIFHLNCPFSTFLCQEKIHIEFISSLNHLLMPNLSSLIYFWEKDNTWNEFIENEAISIHSEIVLVKSF